MEPTSSLPAPALDVLTRRVIAWSAINSGSTHVAGLTRMANALEPALRELTPDVRRVPLDAAGRVALLAHRRPTAPRRVLCSGHYDTVFGADHAFQTPGWRDQHLINGPGVADMKGGIVVMLAALRALEVSPHANGLGWTILLTPDEETGSVASRPLIESTGPGHELALVFEPARENGDMVRARWATALFEAELHGRAAHAGRDPAAGRNAILALAEFCLATSRLPDAIPDALINVGHFAGGSAANIVPDRATAAINARAATPAAMRAVETALRERVAEINHRDGYRLVLRGGFNRAPLVTTALTDTLFANLQACGRDLGLNPFGGQTVGGGSDGNLLHAVGVPVLDGLGPVGGGLHSDNEYIHAASLGERAQLAALFLHRLAAGEIRLRPART